MSKTPDDWLAENEDHLGHAIDIPGPDPTFRARLLDTTAGHVRRRRQRHFVLQAAALVVAFLTGMAVMSGFQAGSNQPEQIAQQTLPDPTTEQPIVPVGDETPGPEFTHALLANPEAFTLRYQQAGIDERLRLLRAAGDYYFFQEGNIDLAADFYRQYLASTKSNSLFFNIDSSNWLFASLAETTKEKSTHETEI